jgi:DNA-binding HxlR family transcriptional regulator
MMMASFILVLSFLSFNYVAAVVVANCVTMTRFRETEKRAQIRGIPTNRCKFMSESDKKFLAIMPKLNSGRVDMLLEDVLGCRWTISVLRAVSQGVRRPGALERHIAGISPKVLSDRLRHFTRAGLFERVQFAEIPPRVEYRLTPFGRKFLKLLKNVEKLQKEIDDSM